MSTLCEGSDELVAVSDCTPATASVTRSGPADRRAIKYLPRTSSCKIPLERLILLGCRPHVGANQASVNAAAPRRSHYGCLPPARTAGFWEPHMPPSWPASLSLSHPRLAEHTQASVTKTGCSYETAFRSSIRNGETYVHPR
jgi:hypothetical protein